MLVSMLIGAVGFVPDVKSIEPAWVFEAPSQSIEWAAPLGNPVKGVIVALSDGRFAVLDEATGVDRSAGKIRLAPGANKATAMDRTPPPSTTTAAVGKRVETGNETDTGIGTGLVYLHDRFRVAAVEVKTGRARWEAGTPPPAELLPDDPEFLNGIVAACEGSRGVWILRKDGTLALLDAETGARVYAVNCGRIDEPRLHEVGGRVVCVGVAEDASVITWVDSTPGTGKLPTTRLPDARIRWSEVFDGGVVATDGRRLFVAREGRAIEEIRRPDAMIQTASLHVAGQRLILANEREEVEAYDLRTGMECWSWNARSSATKPASGGRLRVLHVDESHVVVLDRLWARVLDARIGSQEDGSGLVLPERHVYAVGIASGRLNLAVPPDFGGPAAVWLMSYGLKGGGLANSDESTTETSAVDAFVLEGLKGNRRSIEIRRDRVFVTGSERVVCYEMPDPNRK